MPPTSSPSPLHVVVDGGPAEWWQILAALGPLAVLLGAFLAAFIGWKTLRQRTTADGNALEQRRTADANALEQKRTADANALIQKTEADSRAEWWRRAQWALDRALDEDKGTKALGLATLNVLATSELARKEELELFDIAWKSVAGTDENGAGQTNGGPQMPLVEDPVTGPQASGDPSAIMLISQPSSRFPGFRWHGPKALRNILLGTPPENPLLEGHTRSSVDADDNMGDNGTTDNDKSEEREQ